MLLIDIEKGRIISDEEIKAEIATRHPYKQWLANTQLILEDLSPVEPRALRKDVTLLDRQQAFGYTQEDTRLLMSPMATIGQEAVGSMGTDTPISAMSDKSKLLYTYFKQNFAQVTNPPIDPIREELVMSLVSFIGPRPNIFDLVGNSRLKRLEVRQPILTNGDLEKIRSIGHVEDRFDTKTLDVTYEAEKGAAGMPAALERLCDRAEAAVAGGYNIIILSDRQVGPDRIAIPSLLATAAVHHHLIRKGLRTSVGLVVESAEPREVHHFCCLAGYGAEAINPYLAFDTLLDMHKRGEMPKEVDAYEVVSRYIKSIGKGILKVMSKMGISTYQSYCGAQIFDAVGLSSAFVDKYFTGTATMIEGVGLEEIAEETVRRHTSAFGNDPVLRSALEFGGEYALRLRGESHVWSSETVSTLQHAVRKGSFETFGEYSKLVNREMARAQTIRGLFKIRMAADTGRQPVALDEVEPAKDIVKRFSTGAMSFGSISREAHTTLARAMNAIGGKSNTGEGGEEADRYMPLADGSRNPERSAIKQVASGRFGVTAEYLVNADMMQIKMAQGAKPGEGGQLPGHKVDATIAKVRHSTPGVGLISPPPHHDIYSIEDLAQLIYDLKNVNPAGLVSVKLVSEVGVGTVAAGVAKARADHITISGYEGGTGASPLTSIKHAGSPWEIGLAETQQTLVLNGLRSRVALQVDGGLRTGRDVIVGALLGADEFGFATGPLIAAGCIMMRKCHLNTCPVGVATQDPVLQEALQGTARARHQLPVLHRRRGAPAARRDGLHQARRRDRPVGTAGQAGGDQPLEGARARFHAHLLQARRAEGSDPPHRGAEASDRRRARPQADRAGAAGARTRRAGDDRAADPQRRPHRRRDAVGRDRQAVRPFRTEERHDHREADRHRRPVVRRVPGARRHVRSRRRRQRLCRQGPERRPHRGAPAGQHRRRAGRVDHRRQHRALRRDRGRVLLPRRRRRAFRGAQFRRHRRRRGRRRSWLRIHDRRHRRGDRQDRAQLRGRHVGRHRLCARRAGRFRRTLQHGDGRAGAGARKRTSCSSGCTITAATSSSRAASTSWPTCRASTRSGCSSWSPITWR